MRVVAFSDIGNSRAINEDNYFIPQSDSGQPCVRSIPEASAYAATRLSSDRWCCAVSDGMGGHAAGEIASYETVKYLEANTEKLLEAAVNGRTALVDFFSVLNNTIYDYSVRDKKCRGMGATLCGVIKNGDALCCFNIGDSRCYLLARGTLAQVSVDHTEGERLRRMDLLQPEDLKAFPMRKAIYKYIGQSTPLVADVFDLNYADQEAALLLCTDGLTDVLRDHEIQDILCDQTLSMEEKGNLLVETAVHRKAGSGDNVTLALVQL